MSLLVGTQLGEFIFKKRHYYAIIESNNNAFYDRIHKFDVPRLPHLRKFLIGNEKRILEESVQVRKGYSYKIMLGEIFTSTKP